MKQDIALLREVVVKVTRMLSGMGLRVTQIGTRAYVQVDPKTQKPFRVNIPNIPDDATEDFIFAIQGFIDHEVAHVLFTDFKFTVIATKKGPSWQTVRNILEDTYIERAMSGRFPGTKHNLGRLWTWFVERISDPALAKVRGDERAEFDVIMVPMARALAGQDVFKDWMDRNNFWQHPLVKGFMDNMDPKVLARTPKLKNSAEVWEVAQIWHAVLFPPSPPKPKTAPPPPPPSPPPPENPEDGEKDESEPDDKSEDSDGEGSNKEKPEDEDDRGSGGEQPESDEIESDDEPEGDDDAEGESEGDDAGDAGDQEADTEDQGDGASDAGDPEDQAGDDEPEADPDAAGDGADAPEDGGEGEEGGDQEDEGSSGADGDAGDEDEGDVGSGGASGDDEDGAEGNEDDGPGEDESADPDDGGSGGKGDEDEAEEDVKGGGAQPEGEENEEGDAGEQPEDGEAQGAETDPNPFTGNPPDLSDFGDAIQREISDEAARQTRGSDYSVYTRDHDRIEPLEVDAEDLEPNAIAELDQKTRQMVGVMQKDIERMMAARNAVVRIGGFRSGRLKSASLHRLRIGDDRVFDRKQDNPMKDTAVTLLIDNSGSMHGKKMETAALAGYALSSTLERVNIPHEVLGFTTADLDARFGRRGSVKSIKAKGTGFDFKDYEAEVKRLGRPFTRFEPLLMPIFKGFNERLGPESRKRFAAAAENSVTMANNVDGECLEIAARRLLGRKEVRKVLIVLSDGNPVWNVETRYRGEVYSHLHKVVDDVTKAGVDLIGIGIMSSAVETFYPKHMVLNRIGELPAKVVGELKRILTAV